MDTSLPRPNTVTLKVSNPRVLIPALLALGAGILLLIVGVRYRSLAQNAPLVAESTLAELALWMTEQAQEDAPPSLLGGLAQGWGMDAAALTTAMQTLVFLWCVGAALLIGLGIVGLFSQASWARRALLGGLIGLDLLLLLIPVLEGDSTVALILLGIGLVLAALLFAPGRISKVLGFMVVISVLLIVWESGKALAESINYAITVPQAAWSVTPYSSLEDALAALENGEIAAVVADQNNLEDLMASYPADEAGGEMAYPALRYISRPQQREATFIFLMRPNLPGRLSFAVREEQAAQITRPSQLIGQQVGAVEGDFALTDYLVQPRSLVLLNLQILNDLNLPHLQTIAEAFLQPARRNGEFLLARILGEAALYTWREALFGFGLGVMFGLLLGTLFAHIRLLERALLPYVVASQTVPILAIAPMVVIWFGASFTSVAIIAAYITFFPVTINTLRGLQSPNPTAVELMDSYAASWWTKLWKLRFPAALPYIFTALKVSATASVVGAIIGELPSGMGDGLGRAILDFSSDYSLISTPKLYAAIITAAGVGVIFFVAVSIVERFVLRRYVRSA
ncbi:MAG: ABC transporter permease subunit [bacterium]|nr:ABC transporter permease subunit [bacterium]